MAGSFTCCNCADTGVAGCVAVVSYAGRVVSMSDSYTCVCGHSRDEHVFLGDIGDINYGACCNIGGCGCSQYTEPHRTSAAEQLRVTRKTLMCCTYGHHFLIESYTIGYPNTEHHCIYTHCDRTMVRCREQDIKQQQQQSEEDATYVLNAQWGVGYTVPQEPSV